VERCTELEEMKASHQKLKEYRKEVSEMFLSGELECGGQH